MKKILLVATGSVAIIKVKDLLKKLKQEFEVKLIVTSTVLNNYSNLSVLYEKEDSNLLSFPLHIKHAKWADLIVVAPASANTMTKFVAGIADNQVASTLIAVRTQILFAPAMNTFMYQALKQRDTFNKIAMLGHLLIGPNSGQLWEGETGIGRMSEPQEIVNVVKNYFNGNKKRIILVNGPSKVYIDPISFISNDSTGTMGKLIANELMLLGHHVQIICASKHSNKEILELIKNKKFDTYISPAAIANFTTKIKSKKIKKADSLELKLTASLDLLIEVSKLNKEIIAFKLDDNRQNAITKLNNTNAKFIVWNKIGSMGYGKISGEIIFQNKNKVFNQITKLELAKMIAKEV